MEQLHTTQTEQEAVLDFSSNKKNKLLILEKISSTFVPCFDSIKIISNQLIINKSVFDSHAPRSKQCTKEQEEFSFNLSGL